MGPPSRSDSGVADSSCRQSALRRAGEPAQHEAQQDAPHGARQEAHHVHFQGAARHRRTQARRGPVPPGRIRLRGHFCGVVTTPSHCIEVSLPVVHEVPYTSLHPLLSAFIQEAEAEAKGGGEHGVDSSEEAVTEESAKATQPPPSMLWRDLMVLLAADLPLGGPVTVDRGPLAQQGAVGDGGASAPIRSSVLQRMETHEQALEIDLSAKEALVEDLMREREALRRENEKMRQELEQGLLSRAVSHVLGHASSKVKDEEESEQLAEAQAEQEETQYLRKQSRVGLIEEDPSLMAEGCILLDGHFAGCVITKGHLLEVNLPVIAELPGWPLLEMAQMLASSAKDAAAELLEAEGDDEAPKRHAVMPEVWEGLIKLLKSELPLEATVAGRWRMSSDTVEPQVLASSRKQVDQLSQEVTVLSTELEGLRSDYCRTQMEVAQLRARNSTLSGFLAAAESSALKLRSTLSQAAAAGLSPRQQSPQNRARSGSPGVTGNVEARRRTPSTPPAPAAASTSPPPATNGSEPATVPTHGSRERPSAVEAASVHRTASNSAAPSAADASARGGSSLVAAPEPLKVTAQLAPAPQPTVAPPSQLAETAGTSRLPGQSDSALIADLKELERWAFELRTSGPDR